MKMRAGTIYLLALGVFLAGCSKTENKEIGKSEAARTTLHYSKGLQESSSMTVISAQKAKLVSTLEVFGSLAQDTERTIHIVPKEAGVLEVMKIAVGDTVEKDSPVASIRTTVGVKGELVSSAHGIVMAIYAKEGDSIDPLSSVATIADPDLMRAGFDVYEKDAAFIELGQKVTIKAGAFKAKEFEGKIVYISPRIDEETRTIKIRVDVENKEHLLKFGMFVTGLIERPADMEQILLPLESVQDIERRTIVFVRKEPEVFEIRDVTPGNKNSSQVEILKGVSEGEEVVEKGSFYLKSDLLKDTLGEEE